MLFVVSVLFVAWNWISTINTVLALWILMASWWRHQLEAFSALLALLRGIPRSPVNSPHKGQWHEALMYSLICVWINDWVNNREAGDWRRFRAHYDVIVLWCFSTRAAEAALLISHPCISSIVYGLNHWGRKQCPPSYKQHFQFTFLCENCCRSIHMSVNE